MNYRRLASFTIIELMMVVAIVMIVSGIAMENYSLAKTRTLIARNLNDFRTLAMAIESYHVDHNAFPRMAHYGFYHDPAHDIIFGHEVQGVLSNVISTPIAYISQAYIIDPFMERAIKAPLEERLYTYQDIKVYSDRIPSSKFWPKALNFYGHWRLGGVGPDLKFDHAFAQSAQLPYDSTNGVISLGNLWYGERGSPVTLPPIPDLLGIH